MRLPEFFLAVAALWSPLLSAESPPQPTAIIAVGAGGERGYADDFGRWAANWRKACGAGGVHPEMIEGRETGALSHLRSLLKSEPKETSAELWLVLLGHGTFDDNEGKFNLAGDDLSASELATLLKDFHRPVIVVCGFSASGAFLKPLSATGRIIITATKSGAENNFSRFGGFLSEAIADPAADLDKDGQTSLLEAWLSAAQRTADFYKNEERLATEHSLLDDNGDGFGTPPDWFQGIRAVKKATDHHTPDGLRASQIHLVPNAAERALPPEVRAERDAIEQQLAQLREVKASLPEDMYFSQLETLLVRLAHLYQKHDAAPEAPGR